MTATETRKRVLIVDDEPAIRDSLKLLLRRHFEVSIAENGEEALTLLEQDSPDLVLLDVMMPRLDGLDVLKRMNERGVVVPVIMLTATNTVRTAVQAMKYGAVDFLNKPFDVDELTRLIIETLDRTKVDEKEGESGGRRRHTAAPAGDFGSMVGKSSSMTELFAKVEQVAQRDTTVLITGESGTGKELVARRIHDLSKRKDQVFIAINCAAIPETLIESELFGHEKGAFTHAVERRIGHFERANGGTLFLDEIGELSLNVQVKMLRFLQEQEFYRVGRSKPIQVDVRIVAATNKKLEEAVRNKTFRQDLFYRINVINLGIPALRDRYDDIPYLISHFVSKLSPSYADKMLTFTPEALQRMVTYDWPGNVRELENSIESLLALSKNSEITEADLPRKIRERHQDSDRPVLGIPSGMGFEEAEKIFETEMIVKALKKSNFVQTRAAELLGISRRILKYKMDKLGISDAGEIGAIVKESRPPEEEVQ